MSAEGSGQHRAEVAGLYDAACVQETMVMLNRERQRSALFQLLLTNLYLAESWNTDFARERTGKNISSSPEMQSGLECKLATGKLP